MVHLNFGHFSPPFGSKLDIQTWKIWNHLSANVEGDDYYEQMCMTKTVKKEQRLW